MLQTIGVQSIESLFDQVPDNLQLSRPLELPPPMGELELQSYLESTCRQNQDGSSNVCMMGGGAYDHFIPSVVDEIASRGEFYTAYTPYQAEASQGSLQAFFEYQTLICQLTGMEVSNASLYEGGTSVSEAIFMAMRVTRRHQKIVVLGSAHPEYLQVIRTYLSHLNCVIEVIPTPSGAADLETVEAALDEQTACLVVQHPNFFGCLEEVRGLTQLAQKVGALSVVAFDPISLGILERPGEYGADIAVAEGQSLGTPLQFGGPYLGILACKEKYVRQMPGRLIGQTTDRNGNRCFVLNLQAREQHIRREKATSNICTNQGLLALRATIYLALLGKNGIRQVAELCCRKSHYAAERLADIDGIELAFDQPFFKEFCVRTDDSAAAFRNKASTAGFSIGPNLDQFSMLAADSKAPIERSNLVAITECRSRSEIDQLADALSASPLQAAKQ